MRAVGPLSECREPLEAPCPGPCRQLGILCLPQLLQPGKEQPLGHSSDAAAALPWVQHGGCWGACAGSGPL